MKPAWKVFFIMNWESIKTLDPVSQNVNIVAFSISNSDFGKRSQAQNTAMTEEFGIVGTANGIKNSLVVC